MLVVMETTADSMEELLGLDSDVDDVVEDYYGVMLLA